MACKASECPLSLADFNRNWNMSTNFSKTLHYKFSLKLYLKIFIYDTPCDREASSNVQPIWLLFRFSIPCVPAVDEKFPATFA